MVWRLASSLAASLQRSWRRCPQVWRGQARPTEPRHRAKAGSRPARRRSTLEKSDKGDPSSSFTADRISITGISCPTSIGGRCVPPDLLRPAGTRAIRGAGPTRGRVACVRCRRHRSRHAAFSSCHQPPCSGIRGARRSPSSMRSGILTVSHLVLMNPAPATASDAPVAEILPREIGPDMEQQRAIMTSAAYKEGDPEAVTARYRIHFKPALARTSDYEKLMAAMKQAFISQGKAGIVKARAVEDRLMADSWQLDGYDLLPKLRSLSIPTLIVSGDHDFISGEIARHIAGAIANARLVTLKDCGHFAYLECADGRSEARSTISSDAPDAAGRRTVHDRGEPRGSCGGWRRPGAVSDGWDLRDRPGNRLSHHLPPLRDGRGSAEHRRGVAHVCRRKNDGLVGDPRVVRADRSALRAVRLRPVTWR